MRPIASATRPGGHQVRPGWRADTNAAGACPPPAAAFSHSAAACCACTRTEWADSLFSAERYAFADATARLGADIRTRTPVTGLLLRGGAVTGVRTPSGDISSDAVVCACGAASPRIGAMADLDVPIRPRRGQAYITEAVSPFIRCNLLNARYVVAKHHPELLRGDTSLKAQLGVGFCVTQSAKGNVMFGACREFAGYENVNTPDRKSVV